MAPNLMGMGEWGFDPEPDLWGGGKSFSPMTTEEVEAWEKTARALDGLCSMADGLMLEPLVLALGDALDRSTEELSQARSRLARAQERGTRPRARSDA